MIKFFRRIRQNLLSENKTGKYLKYAIGEIVLVVIGILIALQINNWNENRKNSIKEKGILTQLKKDLEQTDKELEKMKKFFKRRAESAQIVIHSYWTKQHLKDSSLYHFGRVRSNRKYNPILGTAKSLINSGTIELVSSKKLKTSIIEYTETVDALMNDIARYEETYYRTAITSKEFDYFNLIGTYNEHELKNLASADTINRFRVYPKEFKEPPFPTRIEEIYSNKQIYMDYNTLLISHRNTYFKYMEIQEATKNVLTLLIDLGYD